MSDTKFYVYGLFEPIEGNLFDNCFYIGKGKGYRKDKHFKLNKNHNPHKNRKIKKIRRQGSDPYSQVVVDNLSEERAYELEEILIEEIGLSNLTNISPGGDGGLSGKDHPFYGLTGEDHPAGKVSGEDHPLHGRKRSKEFKKKVSESLSGENHPMYGGSHSEETRKKISKANKGKEIPDWQKDLVSEVNKGENNHSSTITKSEASEIKWLSKNTSINYSDIANRYDTTTYVVSDIKTDRSWKHVEAHIPNWYNSDD
ncbi:hypothetical protein OSG_eHP25_00075 [environmental Halophage eHP-25]|nr:hypothetical protein OSG_eHP25_00075 [environmental Halophage eHP-25]